MVQKVTSTKALNKSADATSLSFSEEDRAMVPPGTVLFHGEELVAVRHHARHEDGSHTVEVERGYDQTQVASHPKSTAWWVLGKQTW